VSRPCERLTKTLARVDPQGEIGGGSRAGRSSEYRSPSRGRERWGLTAAAPGDRPDLVAEPEPVGSGQNRGRNLPPNYSITSSARARSVGGMVIPSGSAVLRLITSSNLVGCSTGRSEGFAPLNILST